MKSHTAILSVCKGTVKGSSSLDRRTWAIAIQLCLIGI